MLGSTEDPFGARLRQGPSVEPATDVAAALGLPGYVEKAAQQLSHADGFRFLDVCTEHLVVDPDVVFDRMPENHVGEFMKPGLVLEGGQPIDRDVPPVNIALAIAAQTAAYHRVLEAR